MWTERNKQVVRRFIDEVINGGHIELVDELTDAEYALHFPGRPNPVTRKDLPSFASELRGAFPDWHVQINDMIAEGDKVALLSTVTGTHRGTFQDVLPTGRSVSLRGIAFFELRNGKVLEHRAMLDRMAMFEQLGAKG